MTRPAKRADRLLGWCMLAALYGCAPLQESRHDPHPSATEQTLPVPSAPPATVAETSDQPAQDTPAPAPPELPRTLELLHYAEQYAGLPPEIQHQALAEAEVRHNLEQTSYTLVRYALLLSLSEPERQADAGTADKLHKLIAEAVDDTEQDLVPFAQMLAHVLDEREYLLAQNAELQRKLNQLKAIEQQLGDWAEPAQAAP